MNNCYQARPKSIYISRGNKIEDFFRVVVENPFFDRTISVCIMVNTLSMGITWYQEPHLLKVTMEMLNYLFTVIFTIEAIIKLLALRMVYFHDKWNIFDFMIVCASVIDVLNGVTHPEKTRKKSAITLFRAFRVARLLRLIKRFKSLWKIFDTFIKAMP